MSWKNLPFKKRSPPLFCLYILWFWLANQSINNHLSLNFKAIFRSSLSFLLFKKTGTQNGKHHHYLSPWGGVRAWTRPLLRWSSIIPRRRTWTRHLLSWWSRTKKFLFKPRLLWVLSTWWSEHRDKPPARYHLLWKKHTPRDKTIRQQS